MMRTSADNLSFAGLLAAFGGPGIIESFTPDIHDLVCLGPEACRAETLIIAAANLTVGIAGIVSGYFLIRKTSTPSGSTLAVIPQGQVPATVLVNGSGVKGAAYSLVNAGSSGEVTAITPAAPKTAAL